MECLRRSENADAYEKLKHAEDVLLQAERVCPPHEASELSCARAAIASSFAICYKREDDYPMAVRFLETALDLYVKAEADLRTLMAARLNLSGCFSEAEMPEEAQEHAMAAVALGGQLIATGNLPGKEERNRNQEQGVAPPSLTIRPDDYAMLAVAYHKTAEAHEHMKQWGQATLAYTQAYEVVRRSLGPYHQLTKSFEKSARCPRMPAALEVPPSWRARSALAAPKGTPRLPHVDRTSRPNTGASDLRGTAKEPLGYRLSPQSFPSWPPKSGVTEEENHWYQLAIHERKQKKASVNQIRDAKWSGRNPGLLGQTFSDIDTVSHRNVAARGGSAQGLTERMR